MAKFTVNVPVETNTPNVVVDADPQAALPPGRHRFSLVVVDDSGNESTPDTVDVIVADRDRPTAVLQGPDVASAGKPFTLSGARSFDTGGGIIKTWRFTYLGLATR
ncbi:hypothetical protein [Roseateles puraquae]|uniref:Uncharacterized protein n=1 Tax=Roseateles puraquae TaxID=431059 RepID=A0A254N6G9_9BURK|nr:hypothetical protein [Roseateles puraquae]MDG0856306.1 hypothetical protein [Roseateles puraquae]OWR01967.1 hypothetical protein CDO81_21800 [Roseateles puraquae]